MDLIKQVLNEIRQAINGAFRGKEPWQIVTFTTSSVLITVWVWDFIYRRDETVAQRGKKTIFAIMKRIPAIRDKIDKEMKKIADDFDSEAAKRTVSQEHFKELPPKGLSSKDLMELVESHLELGDFDWREGRVSGAVYYYEQDLIDLITKVYGLASYTNPLHPDIFPGVNKMEAEVVRMTAKLFHGGPNACGCMTTGGTESILLACKAYRDYARAEHGIRRPEIVLPTTAHSAFDKAAQFLGLRVRSIRVDPVTLEVDVKAMASAINSNTVMLVGSAPNFPYGTMDDIVQISNLGVKHNIPVHVDACLGGFVIAFADQAGHKLPLFDFRLPGVTSISADTHKYGFAPKGSSVVMYSEKKFRHHQFTVTTDWPGGVYGSPTVSGSRAGGIIAACWATLLYFGMEGYIEATKAILDTTHMIENEIRKIDGVYIYGKPATSVIALGSKVFDIYRLSSALNKKGWNLNVLQFPSGIHLCVTHLHTKPGVAALFVDDIKHEIAIIMKNPGKPVEGKMAIYGVAQEIPDRSVVGDFTKFFLDSMYYTPES